MVDEQLVNVVREFIRARGSYVRYSDLENAFGNTRIYYTYRGINLTELNAEFGFVRRARRIHVPRHSYDRDVVEAEIRNLIRERGEYTPLVHISRIKRMVPDYVIRDLGIDIHRLNLEAGYLKRSSKEKFVWADLKIRILEYIHDANSWVHQPEICRVFGISTSYLTKSDLDTVAANYSAGHAQSISYFEVVTLKLLRSMYSGEIVCQKMFTDLRSASGTLLRFDFYIPEWKVAIEVDGPQHWDPSNRYHSPRIVYNDNLKNIYCTDNSIKLCRIRYPEVGRLTYAYVRTALLENLESFLTTTGSERVDVNV